MSFRSTGSPRPGSRVRGSTSCWRPGPGRSRPLSPLIAPGSSRGRGRLAERRRRRAGALDPERARPRARGRFARLLRRLPRLRPQPRRATFRRARSPTSGSGPRARQSPRCSHRRARRRPGSRPASDDLVEGIRRSADLDLERGVLEALGDEAAIALEPPAGGRRSRRRALRTGSSSADEVDEVAARAGLAALGGSLAHAVARRRRGAGVQPGGCRRSADQHGPRLADGRAHLRRLRRARRDRDQPGRGRSD